MLIETVKYNYKAKSHMTTIPVVSKPYPICIAVDGSLLYDSEDNCLVIYVDGSWRKL